MTWFPIISAASGIAFAAAAVPLLLKATVIAGAALVLDFLLHRRFALYCSATWNGTMVLLAALPIAALVLPQEHLPQTSVTGAPRDAAAVDARPATKAAAPSVAIDPSLTTSTAIPAAPETSISPRPTRAHSPAPGPAPAAAVGAPIELPTVAIAAAPDVPETTADTGSPVATAVARVRAWLLPGLLMLYGCGLLAMAAHLLGSVVGVVRLRRSSQPLDNAAWQVGLTRWSHHLDMRRKVVLRQSSAIQVPIVVGFIRPAIVLPTEFALQAGGKARDAILVHELTHVARGDAAWQFLQRVVVAMLWFHPLMWLAQRRMALVRERVCDEHSVYQLGGKAYITILLDMAARLTRRTSLSLGMAVLRTSQLDKRLAYIHGSRGFARFQAGRATRLAILAVALGAAAWAGRTAIADPPVAQVPGLPDRARSLTAGYENDAARLRGEADRKIAEKREKLLQSLQDMLDEYMRQGLTNEAQAVREQIRLLKEGALPGATCIKADDSTTMTNYRSRVGQSFCFQVVGATSGYLWGTDLYTDDSAIATAAVHAGVLQAGESGIVKVSMLPGQATYQGSARHGIQSNDWKNSGIYSSYTIERVYPAVAAATAPAKDGPPSPPGVTEIDDIGPPETAFPAISAQSVGQSFLMTVTGGTSGSVWGTEKYTHDSSIPAAAVHAGILQPGERAIVKVTVSPGLPYYQGSTHNGVASRDWSNSGNYVTISIERASQPLPGLTTRSPQAAVAVPATMAEFAPFIGHTYTFNVTGDSTGLVWGTDLYTNDSSLAAAAVHAGVLQPGETALVKVTILPGVPQYHGSTRNGVTSRDWENRGDYVSYVIQRATPLHGYKTLRFLEQKESGEAERLNSYFYFLSGSSNSASGPVSPTPAPKIDK
jgi:beta-lactamase regulating signal transducer with metallopeptidase domain